MSLVDDVRYTSDVTLCSSTSNGSTKSHKEDINEPCYDSDKKTDEENVQPPPPSGGYLWRISSGIVSTTTGAVTGVVGYGVGGVKWAAGVAGSAGSAVVGTTKNIVTKVPVPLGKKKDKKE